MGRRTAVRARFTGSEARRIASPHRTQHGFSPAKRSAPVAERPPPPIVRAVLLKPLFCAHRVADGDAARRGLRSELRDARLWRRR
jgi:hypothetical protein